MVCVLDVVTRFGFGMTHIEIPVGHRLLHVGPDVPSSRGAHVLVVDDDPALLRALRSALGTGYVLADSSEQRR
jgi:hypothetical protein